MKVRVKTPIYFSLTGKLRYSLTPVLGMEQSIQPGEYEGRLEGGDTWVFYGTEHSFYLDKRNFTKLSRFMEIEE